MFYVYAFNNTVLIQWGKDKITINVTKYVTLPLAYTKYYSLGMTTSSALGVGSYGASPSSLTQLYAAYLRSNHSDTVPFYWMSIGV